MPDTAKETAAPIASSASSPAETITTPVEPATEAAPASVTVQGVPNGLPPAAPGVQLQPPPEVIALREWFHVHVKNSIHSRDTDHYNVIQQHVEAVCAKLHSKYPLEG